MIDLGHDKLPADPGYIVTLDQSWEANQDFTFAEMLDIRNNLNAVGWAWIGGGAAAAFTLKLLWDKLPSASSLAAAERDAPDGTARAGRQVAAGRDFTLRACGRGLTAILPHTNAARAWIEVNADDAFFERGQYGFEGADALFMEPSYAVALMNGIVEAGLRIACNC